VGFDVHRFAAGRLLVLGGVRIPHPRGLLGHSDADVLAHAIMDALLGAVAAGDIGEHFPDTGVRWKNADSLALLRKVMEIVAARSAKVINVDAMVMAEEPKLAPHVLQMRRNLAAAMRLPVDCVSVKATTMEGIGAIGRKQGMAVMAIATVDQKKASSPRRRSRSVRQ
jgi:2-C-methyl-D-erythritol 2,4-cyclodiphosphate synthase